MMRPRRGLSFLLFIAAIVVLPLRAQFAGAAHPARATLVPRDRLLQPGELHRLLEARTPLLILQVGSKVLYQQAHIPGAEHTGSASTPAGIAALRARVQHLPRTQLIVIYCGCCPWEKCPNIGPAWRLLRSMGFTHVRALHIADNFGADWVGRGYDVASSR